MELFPYQIEGAKWLAGKTRALLFDAPGLGKTIQAIAAAEIRGEQRFDVIAPASVRSQWAGVLQREGVAIVRKRAYSYEHARDKALPRRIGTLVIDEAHALKSRFSGRTLKVYGEEPFGTDGLVGEADVAWAMTGTPMPKDASDLYPMMRALVPKSLRDRQGSIMDFWEYMKRFTVFYSGQYGIVVKSHKNEAELRDRLAPYMLRRLKRDVLKDWKKPVIATVEFEAKKGMKALLSMEATNPEAALVARTIKRHGIEGLANIANEQTATLRRYTGMLLIEPVAAWLADKFDNGEGKMVVICYHREVVEGIQRELKKRGYASVTYMGGMAEKQKDNAKRLFIDGAEVKAFIGQITAAGTGLDGLQRVSSRMLLVEYSWIPTENEQAIGRIDRIGQRQPVLVEFAAIAGSMHEAITRTFIRRAQDNEAMFG